MAVVNYSNRRDERAVEWVKRGQNLVADRKEKIRRSHEVAAANRRKREEREEKLRQQQQQQEQQQQRQQQRRQ